MTREDIEQLNQLRPYCFESDREEEWYNFGLKEGLEVADSEPIYEIFGRRVRVIQDDNSSEENCKLCCLRDFCEKSHVLCEDSQGNYSRHFEE